LPRSKTHKPHDNLVVALDAHEKGLVTIPMFQGTKVPALKTWKEWQTQVPSVELIQEWFRNACNIALVCTSMVIFDCETMEKTEVVLRECGDTPYKVRTGGGGVHLGFRRRKGSQLTNQVRIKGLDIDIRTDGGLAIIPNSQTEKGRYEWLTSGLLPISEVPVANIGWTRTRTKKRKQSIVPPVTSGNRNCC
jgi:Bifunctional DNA primase/polymerase, N-terminal